MLLRCAVILMVVGGGCGGSHLRREIVGGGTGSVGVRGQEAPATTVQLGKGNYDVALRFDVPRAQLVDYDFVCDGMPISHGQVGETFEAYRKRRLYQLQQQNERDRRAAASVTGAVVGAV